MPENILMLSLAGNTAMTHFFMGLKPGWMIREPYIPVVNRPGFLISGITATTLYLFLVETWFLGTYQT